MFVINNQVFLPTNMWVGALRVKLTIRTPAGEQTVFIPGKRAKKIQEKINEKLPKKAMYALVEVILFDRGNKPIAEKSVNLVSSKQSLESFLETNWIKSFLKYNVGLH